MTEFEDMYVHEFNTTDYREESAQTAETSKLT